MTSPCEEDRIRELAVRLRRALDSIPKSELPLQMREFPRGACGDAALLLGALLADSDIAGFELVSAERGSVGDDTWTSHAWLARGPLVVDITADQFADAPSAVIVAHNSAWHSTFEIEHTAASDFRATWSPGNVYLGELHQRIESSLAHE